MYTILWQKINMLEEEIKLLKENMIPKNTEKKKEPYAVMVKVDDVIKQPKKNTIEEQIKRAKDMYQLRLIAAKLNLGDIFGRGISFATAKRKILQILVI